MIRMTIELPEDIRSRLQTRAAETGYETVEQYVLALLRSDTDASAIADEDYGAPAHLHCDNPEQLEALNLNGLDSGPATDMTGVDWQSVHSEAVARIAPPTQHE